jgi:hypothetical protein
MNTPNETPEHHSNDQADATGDRKQSKGKRPDRTQRAAFWLRTIELRKQKLTREYRKSLRDVAREGISDEEYAAMLGTLEKMARNLGWDESQKDERPFGRGFGRGFARGPRHPAMLHGFGHGHGHGDHHEHGHDGEHGHGHGHGEHDREHRYPGAKRGFRRLHPADHHGHRPVATDSPQA